MIPFDNTYARLPERFYARVDPEQVPAPNLIKVNEALAQQLHLDPAWLGSPEGVAMLSGNTVVEGSEPIAQAYAGHQFGGWNPQLGDGRAVMLGEIVGTDGVRLDVQLKGSGHTPFSRQGDGKAALGPALREYLMSEAMTTLGVPSTRALAVLATGEKVQRETPLDGGLIVRVASSHLRVGTFQYFLAREDEEALKILVDFALARHYPKSIDAENRPLALLKEVVVAQAKLVAQWMSLGFIHGVMNTDNCAVSGETIDYGPCAFMEAFHPNCVFSAIDSGARYAWGNQAMMGQWNVARFAEAMLPIMDDSPDQAKEWAEEALSAFADVFAEAYHGFFFRKLGVTDDTSGEFVQETLGMLQEHEVDFTLFFRRLTQFASGEDNKAVIDLVGDSARFEKWRALWEPLRDLSGGVAAMQKANPILIPRNHRIEQAIQDAYAGDMTLFHRLAAAWQHPFESRAEYADLEALPEPGEEVKRTFCGT